MQIEIRTIVSKESYKPSGSNPLEALLSALGGCIGIYANKYLERHAISFTKLEVGVRGEFTTESPARIINIKARVSTDAQLGDNQEVFLRFIRNCPVHNTLLNASNIEIGLN